MTNSHAYNKRLYASWRFSNGPSALVMLINFINLALANRVYSGQASSSNTDFPTSVKPRTLCVILAANAVKTKRLRISEPSFYHFIFLKNLYNKSILFEQRIGIASKRVSSSHSHHFISCNFWMSSSLNLFFINLAGFPPTIE